MARKQDAPNRDDLGYVIIAWKDHFDLGQPWVKKEELPGEDDNTLIISGGFLLDENDEHMVIARDLIIGDECYGGVMVILKGTIVKRWELGNITL